MANEQKMIASAEAWANIHRGELVRDLMEMVRIRSVAAYDEEEYPLGEGCYRAAEKLMQLGRRYGFQTENDGYCASVILPGTEPERELGLLGHIDVVPEGEGWHYAPFDAVEKDGYVIGRGASDNKGPVVTALYVLRWLHETGVQLRHSVRLIAGMDEEREMRDVKRFVKTHSLPDYTLNVDGAWALCIGEKGILSASLEADAGNGKLLELCGGEAVNAVPDHAWAVLSHAEPGALEAARAAWPELVIEAQRDRVRLQIHGTAAHASTPERGDNAILELIRVLKDSGLLEGDAHTAVSRLCQCFTDHYGSGLRINHEDRLSGKTTCVPSVIRMHGGVIRLTINVRSAITQRGDMLLAFLKKRSEKLGLRVADVDFSPGRCDDPKDPIISMLSDTCQSLLGSQYKPYATGGGTHSRCFPRSVPFGPGIPGEKGKFGQPHGADEAVCIDHLISAVKVYAAALIRLDTMLQD